MIDFESFLYTSIQIASIGLSFIFFIWIMFLLPISMAEKRGRNPIGWIFLFWVLTPFWGAILLLILGDSKEKIKQDILNEINNHNVL